MSRLDSFIRRVSAQRDCLNVVVEMIRNVEGPILEIGLGNGRTYDHLREKLSDRQIFVFDRQIAAHPACTPDDQFMVLGDLRDTLPAVKQRLGQPAAMAHADIGSGNPDIDAGTSAFLSRVLPALMAPEAVVLCDQKLDMDGWKMQPLPEGVRADRYFLYRTF